MMMLIGDYSWVLYVIFGSLGVLLTCYGIALLVVSRVSRPKRVQEGVRPATGKGLDARPTTS
jgi:hypothetical protein